MLQILKRFSFGLGLIALASAVLLLADLQSRRGSRGRVRRIAILQLASRPALDDSVAGMLEGLRAGGYSDGGNVKVQLFNPQGDLPTANVMAGTIAGTGFDLVLTASTPALQVMAAANREGRVVHVFSTVTDPVGAGVGIGGEEPEEHPRHIVGVGTFQPVRETIQLALRMNGGLKVLGVPWCPAEACAEACVRVAREECGRLGIRLEEASAESTASVHEAAQSLAQRGVQALWVGGDNTVEAAMGSVVKAGREAGIPVLCNAPLCVKDGVLFGLGADYFEVGKAAGDLAARILGGLDPGTVPIGRVVPVELALNLPALEGLRETWTVPPDDLASAATVIGEDGAVLRSPKKAGGALGNLKKWRIYNIRYAEERTAEAVEEGFFGELERLGFEEGRDYELKRGSAQRDMATLINLIDDAKGSADLLFLVSTPTLQTAIRRVSDLPMVFSNVGAPLQAGVGKNFEEHLPNVTGICVMSDFEGEVAAVRRVLPRCKRLGTLYTPAEVNSVVYRDALAAAASKAGLQLESVPVASSSDVADAALALAAKGLDAVCQISDNTVTPAFGVVTQAGHRHRVPVFAFVSGHVHKDGAVLARCRDYEQAGRDAAGLAARVMRGESPALIPIRMVSRTTLVISPKNAAAFGLAIPPDLLKEADEVVK